MQQSEIPVTQNKILSITTTEIPGNKIISVTTSTTQQLPMQPQPTQVAVYLIVAFTVWFAKRNELAVCVYLFIFFLNPFKMVDSSDIRLIYCLANQVEV